MDRLIQILVEAIQWWQKMAWTVADRFMPEAREGYPYVMYGQIANLAASATGQAFPANTFNNPTADELVIDYFRIEAQPAAAYLAAGGTAIMGGAQDFNIGIRLTDQAHNAPSMQVPVPIGVLLDPISRKWYPTRKIILPGGSQAQIQVLIDNLTAGPLTNIHMAAHCHARTRKNTPQ